MASGPKSIPNFGQASKTFIKAGIPAKALLPIAPVDARISKTGDLDEKNLGKAPGRYRPKSDDWCGLGGDYINRGVPPEDQEAFATWPTPNVGMLGRCCPAIDSDAESEDARRLVDRAMAETFGSTADYAERLRGDGPRRLYAFKHRNVGSDRNRIIRPRHIHYRMHGDKDGHPVNKLDVSGAGNQYLIAGEHQSGDHYEWHPDAHLADLFESGRLVEVERKDIDRFLAVFTDLLERDGGEILRSNGGGAPGAERDFSKLEPIMPVDDILDGLERLPNDDRDNFPSRDEFVSMVAAIRAALGCEAKEYRDEIEQWACKDPDWCPDRWFDQIWHSLDRGVRVDRNSLDRRFKRAGVYVSARSEFPDDAKTVTKGVKEHKEEKQSAAKKVLREVEKHYVFGRVNTRTDDSILRMRHKWGDPAVEWRVIDWWKLLSDDPDTELVEWIQENERYPANEVGMWRFIRDMRKAFPNSFYTGETRHPNYERGQIVLEEHEDKTTTREINMRFLSPVIWHASRSLPTEPHEVRRAQEDVNTILEFIHSVFGNMSHYELDTLAFMAQSGRRPGHMLFLVGDMGVGKSIYAHMLISMFDGIGKEMGGQIDGTKLTSEASRRFALARVEGCRIISVKELPEGSGASNMAAITSSLKQIVDPGPDGDWFQIEAKGANLRMVRNHARVITTSNYTNSLQVEENDRRIFYVRCGINLENKPEPEYYADLTDVTTNPVRLAAFWRYLLDRDVSRYDVNNPPPITSEKREAMVLGLTNPLDRHMTAALEVLRAARRYMFDARELQDIMTAMSENEFRNTNGEIDDRRDYDFRTAPSAAKRIFRYAFKLVTPRETDVKHSTIYAFRNERDRVEHLMDESSRVIVDTLAAERRKKLLSREHPFAVFSGPFIPERDRQR